MELFELIQTLTAAYGPAGDEGEIRDLIAGLAQPYADEITTDVMGNLIVHKKGSGPRVMFSAHMDSIGFMVTRVEKEGYLRAGRLGGIPHKKAVYTPVRLKNGRRGVFAPEEKADMGQLKLDECYLDIGVKDEAEARSLVQVGDTAVYDVPARRCGQNVISPYLDDRIACAIQLAALERVKDSPNDLYFVFSVQEELGIRGAKTAAWAIDPDYGIAVDVTTVDDTPGSEKSGTSRLGKGAAVKIKDNSLMCHPQVVAKLEELAQQQNIPVQRDIIQMGGTDAGAIQSTRAGVYAGGISIPTRYIHTPQEMADLGDTEACVRLVAAFAQAQLDRP